MEVDAVIDHPMQAIHDGLDPVVLQQLGPHVAVGAMHGDVDGRELLVEHPLPVRLLHVGEGGEVPVEEGVAVVLVLHVKGLAHALRSLVDETEDAIVLAEVDLHHLRLDAEHLAGVAFHGDAQHLLPAHHFHVEEFSAAVELEVQAIPDLLLVDAEDLVPGEYSGALRVGFRLDGSHLDHFSSF
jgi:hypothetical protein